MRITNKEYAKIVKRRSPNTKTAVTTAKAFIIGGFICVIGQAFNNLYKHLGADVKTTGTLTSITLIFISALLTVFKAYDRIASHGGAGTLVPITGFSNAVVSSGIEYKTEGYIMGIGAKMFTIAGPVIVYGVLTSVLYGIILFIAQSYN
ncbi:MAG: SpoVA/SpoVAEb family sporulation membrane protein [Eubacterium sp.]|jgi:stage V sporulation protein AC|nr:SpoVA/SpoVAEb family sporulation membrane protein [Eubacterium sp.]